MTIPLGYFALLGEPDFGPELASRSPGVQFNTDAILIIATGFTLALGLMLWARYVRGRNRADAVNFHPQGDRSDPRRRRRRVPLKRNPTRAETGGLPPIRADDKPLSSP